PAEMYFSDFDNNGSVDPIFCYYIQGKSYPYLTRDELLGQLAGLRSKFTSYKSYADATLTDIFSSDELKNANKLLANHFQTTLFLSNPQNKFLVSPLPVQSQYSPVYSIAISDFDHDGNKDMILMGNNHNFKLRLGKFDANFGTLLLGDGKGGFQYVNQIKSGLDIRGAVKSSVIIGDQLLIRINKMPIRAYTISQPSK
ncbi:MAG: RNA-binding protein, partial [Maribacter sp.]